MITGRRSPDKIPCHMYHLWFIGLALTDCWALFSASGPRSSLTLKPYFGRQVLFTYVQWVRWPKSLTTFYPIQESPYLYTNINSRQNPSTKLPMTSKVVMTTVKPSPTDDGDAEGGVANLRGCHITAALFVSLSAILNYHQVWKTQ